MHTLNICTPGNVDPYDSYGLIACQLARHLTGLGCYVNLYARGYRERDNQPEDIRAIVAQPIRAAYGAIMLGYPTQYHEYSNPLTQLGRRVAVTMFESSKPPAKWLEPLNACDAVVVPSEFCRDVFRQEGVTTPVHVVPLGVGELYKPAPRREDRPFTCLAFMDRGLRKGGLDAVQVFIRAFGGDMDYRLILKSRNTTKPLVLTNKNIDVIHQDMSEAELYRLYLECDVLINPNKGEGFGLLPREFAATGGIALATNWGGTADDIDLWGVPLPYTLVPAQWDTKGLRGQDLGVWAKPDVDAAAAILRDVAERRESYRRRAMLAASYARQMYRWRDFAAMVLEIWEEGIADGRTERLSTLAC
jgi:glycosyltransferase involved in cell wall biosynthesis